jgi:hypothetical protein
LRILLSFPKQSRFIGQGTDEMHYREEMFDALLSQHAILSAAFVLSHVSVKEPPVRACRSSSS